MVEYQPSVYGRSSGCGTIGTGSASANRRCAGKRIHTVIIRLLNRDCLGQEADCLFERGRISDFDFLTHRLVAMRINGYGVNTFLIGDHIAFIAAVHTADMKHISDFIPLINFRQGLYLTGRHGQIYAVDWRKNLISKRLAILACNIKGKALTDLRIRIQRANTHTEIGCVYQFYRNCKFVPAVRRNQIQLILSAASHIRCRK